MNIYYYTKHWLKLGRWQARRSAAALRWGSNNLKQAPIVLGNAMPKSGSHLIIQILQGLPHLGPFVDPGFPPVNRSEDNSKLLDKAVLRNLQRMRPGDIGYGYLKARQPFLSTLIKPGRAIVFIFRDPRDMIVSHVFYATQMHKGHGMHPYYTETLTSMDQRISAAIQGVEKPGFELSPIRAKYEGYLGWLKQDNVLCLRFEDLILNREIALGNLMDYLEQRGFKPSIERFKAINLLQQAINPQKSGTFRKGQPGNWREYFSEDNKNLFKENAGEILIRLGYEANNDW